MSRMNLFTIPAGAAFADDLARGILKRCGASDNPFALSEAWVFVPTRRAIRTLKESFERVSPNAVTALPRICAFGDLDEDPSPLREEPDEREAVEEIFGDPNKKVISQHRREMIFMRLIQHWSAVRAEANPELSIGAERPALALQLARELTRIIDLATSEGLAWERLPELVPDELSEHWQDTLKFLSIVTEQWPLELDREKATDPAVHRDAALREAARRWRESPPYHHVFAAGSTGSVPATAELLKTIAQMPDGYVILPGLDLGMDEDAWAAMGPGHPQHGMGELLKKFDVTRADVEIWEQRSLRPYRARLIGEALRPAETTVAWRRFVSQEREHVARALEGLTSVVARTPHEEALVIACALREAAEVPDKTAALVTPDRNLARRVAAELKRWGIVIDDSAGTPLSHTEPGRFLCLIADVIAEEFAPVSLLAFLKHPMTSLGFDTRSHVRALSAELEMALLRGPRVYEGLGGLRKAGDPKAAYYKVIEQLGQAVGSFAECGLRGDCGLIALLQSHRNAAELASYDLSDPDERVWDNEAGKAAFELFESLIEACADLDLCMSGADYAQFIRTVMDAISVRPKFGLHPRLSILGPLEARLQQADLMILGGLVEGKWPPATDPGPWLNRPMRRELMLSQPERRIGLSAHDFVQASCAEQVLLTRAEKDEGAPTTPSRWLTRLNILIEGAGLKVNFSENRLLDIARQLDRPILLPRAVEAPAPCPPVAARPRELAVTDVERWVRDPYALYAKKILGLKKLAPIDAAPGAAERGTIIHKVLEKFVQRFPKELPSDEEGIPQLLELGREVFGDLLKQPGVGSIWWPRFERMATWYLAWERDRRGSNARVLAEQKSRFSFRALAGEFTLTAKADRIEVLPDGEVAIGDYKTGRAATVKEVQLGFNPQLTLEGAIALEGGFPGITASAIKELFFVSLKGAAKSGEEKPLKFDGLTADQASREALAKFRAYVDAYDLPDMPYLSKPHVLFKAEIGDYDHLARVKEWSSESDE